MIGILEVKEMKSESSFKGRKPCNVDSGTGIVEVEYFWFGYGSVLLKGFGGQDHPT